MTSQLDGPARAKLHAELLDFLKSRGLTTDAEFVTDSLEKIVSNNKTFLDVLKWRTGLGKRELQVGRVERAGEAWGTGFLIGPDLLLTNYHVIKQIVDQAEARGWAVRFDYKTDLDGVAVSPGVTVEFARNGWLVDASPYSELDCQPIAERAGREPGADQLDFALIRLAEPVGEQRGWVKLLDHEPEWSSIAGVCILQHPLGSPLKLALGIGTSLTRNGPGTRIRYDVPTERGSSGSPVFDTDWQLIGLHHSGDPSLIDPSYNEAIPIHLITARLKLHTALGAEPNPQRPLHSKPRVEGLDGGGDCGSASSRPRSSASGSGWRSVSITGGHARRSSRSRSSRNSPVGGSMP